jgi:hypothetical protein
MIRLIRDAVHAIWSAFTRPSDLMLENIALKHQLNVVLRTSPPRPRLSAIDRILWVWLSRTWSGWNRPARYRHRLASPGLAALLDLEEKAPGPGPAAHCAERS